MLELDVTEVCGVRSRVSQACVCGDELYVKLLVLNPGSRWAKQNSLSTSAPYFLLYCVFSPIYSFEWYISLFLPLSLHFLTVTTDAFFRHPSDGVNTCCPVSIAPISQPSLSHLLAFPNNHLILPQVHPLKRTTSRSRRLQMRQVPPPFSVLRHATQYFF